MFFSFKLRLACAQKPPTGCLMAQDMKRAPLKRTSWSVGRKVGGRRWFQVRRFDSKLRPSTPRFGFRLRPF